MVFKGVHMTQKEDLLFYSAYEDFYDMAGKSDVFQRYCLAVYGKDFSQDGFSDLSQIEDILKIANVDRNSKVLDIGCGNGKMLQFINKSTGAAVSGFDYSDKAIAYANENIDDGSGNFNFISSAIGEIEYPVESFDLITSIDTVYFARDMKDFIKQVYGWLKSDGYFICGYQEGDVMPKTQDKHSSAIALALQDLNIGYVVIDYTERTYQLLLHKRNIAQSMKHEFIEEGIEQWYDVAIGQSLDRNTSFEMYEKQCSRYLYIIKKDNK